MDLAQAEVLMAMQKIVKDGEVLSIPRNGSSREFEITSLDKRETFYISMQRGLIRLSKHSTQERTADAIVLLRLCVDYKPHTNPDTIPPRIDLTPYRNTRLGSTHLHIFTDGGVSDRWAMPVPDDAFSNLNDLATTLRDFLEYCNVINIPTIQVSLF